MRMPVMRLVVTLPALLTLLTSCSGERAAPGSHDGAAAAIASLTVDDLMRHTQVLASDAYAGRAPGSAGEDSTVAYLERQFRGLGLEPGNPDGTFIQEVPLVGIRTTSDSWIMVGERRVDLTFPDDYVVFSKHVTPGVDVEDSELVFVGYGVVAPEYDWDDYKDADLRGKTLVMLVNDPAIPDPRDSTALDSAMFNGEAMTYYGR